MRCKRDGTQQPAKMDSCCLLPTSRVSGSRLTATCCLETILRTRAMCLPSQSSSLSSHRPIRRGRAGNPNGHQAMWTHGAAASLARAVWVRAASNTFYVVPFDVLVDEASLLIIDAVFAQKLGMAEEASSRKRRCRACGGISSGSSCEYCGSPLDQPHPKG